MSTTEQGDAKKRIPFVTCIKIPSSPSEKPHLVGMRCRACKSIFVDEREVCGNCSKRGDFEEIALSTKGELWTFTIVHQSAPGIAVPYVAGIVDLPEGVSVSSRIVGVGASPDAIKVGMKVELELFKVRTNSKGEDVMAYQFRTI